MLEIFQPEGYAHKINRVTILEFQKLFCCQFGNILFTGDSSGFLPFLP